MDIKKVTKLTELLGASQLNELNYSDEQITVNVKKAAIPVIIEPIIETIKAEAPVVKANTEEITSEGVGFFHKTINDKDISKKSTITKGAEVFYVKSMNLEHHKRLEFDCKVVEYLVEEGVPVEYGQPVIIVEKI